MIKKVVVEIINPPVTRGTKVFIDGHELPSVRTVKVIHAANDVPVLQVEFIAEEIQVIPIRKSKPYKGEENFEGPGGYTMPSDAPGS